MGPFSVTGQPNAIGGREVGGLANMLAAHMELENAGHRAHVQSFWQSPTIAAKPGLKAVDMFDAVADGRIKALWIMATNPADSMPEADAVRDALAACPFVVVSDIARHTDTTERAHVLLPSTAWGEKSGTVTNSERRISRQRPFLPAPGEARPDWWQLAQVANRMGHGSAFNYSNPHEIFIEHARLTGQGNDGARDLNIGAAAAMTARDYEALSPFQWPKPTASAPELTRFFADGGFFTPDGRGRFVSTPYKSPPTACSEEFPLILNTGRIRDQWHTMTRTAKAPRLMQHLVEPFVEIHPSDATQCGLKAAGLAQLRSRHGTIIVRVALSEDQRRGSVFVPMHWTNQLASCARVDTLVAAERDPVSGQPGFKQTPVNVAPFIAAWHGFALTQNQPDLSMADYFAQAPVSSGWRAELAGRSAPDEFTEYAGQVLGLDKAGDVELLSYHDRSGGQHRFAAFQDGRLIGALFIAPEPLELTRSWLADQLDLAGEGQPDRLRVLAGRPGAEVKDRGTIVCACFEVGFKQIVEAVDTGQCLTVEAVGELLKAGSNCGAGRAEIGRIVHDRQIAQAS